MEQLKYRKSITKCLKGNPTFHGILNSIIQILHYYYRKQHKNIKTSQTEQNLIISLPFFLFTVACASFIFLAAEFLSSWTQHFAKLHRILNITSDHSWNWAANNFSKPVGHNGRKKWNSVWHLRKPVGHTFAKILLNLNKIQLLLRKVTPSIYKGPILCNLPCHLLLIKIYSLHT